LREGRHQQTQPFQLLRLRTPLNNS
jgi:hypothetical protein